MLKLFDPRWLIIVMLFTIAALPVRTHADTPTVVISEIAWAGSSISSSDEWIELTNVSNTAVDLSGWILSGAGTSGTDLVLPDGAQLEPYSTFVIANYEHTHANSALESAPSYVTSTLSLSNDGFSLALFDSGGALMDVAGGTGSPFAGRSGGTGDSDDGRYASMVRSDGLGDGSLEESWADADMSSGFKTNVQDLGTPGSVVFATTVVIPSETNEASEAEGSPSEETESSGDPSSTDETRQDDTDVSETTEEAATEEPVTINILINEFVVDPLGDGVEWIELYNAGDSSVTLEGWSIEDAAGKSTDLSTITIEVGSYAVVEEPNGKLNNDGDSIILKDATGTVIETVMYGGDGYPVPKDGNALARNGETFEITQQPTPGSANVIAVSSDEETVEEVTVQEETVEEETMEEVEADEAAGEESSSSASKSETNEASDAEESQAEVEATEEIELIKTIRFVSLYPNATGSDEEEEYIVIENTGSEAIDLLGWFIQDGSTDRYTFESSVMIESGATFTLGRPQSKLTLNNGGDTLELIAPDGEVVDLVTYGTSTKGTTYDLVDGTWTWSGTATVAETTVTESTATESTTTSAPTTTSTKIVSNSTSTASTASTAFTASTTYTRVAQVLTIAQAKEKNDGQNVTLKGVVISAPGTFGSQIFYLQDETGGIQVYLYSGDFPELAVGDVIQVTGELSTSRGERRVKLASTAGIVSSSGTFESIPIEIAVSDLHGSFVGMLMTVQGQIQSIDTNKLVIEKEGATLTIYLKSNPVIDAQQFERGDKIEITGVLTSYDGGLRLRPRSVDDVMVIEETTVASAITTESSAGSSTGMILLVTTMAALVALAIWRYLPRRRLTSASA